MPPRPLPQDKFRDIVRTLIRLATNIQEMQPAIQAFLAQNPDVEQDLAEDGTSVNSHLTLSQHRLVLPLWHLPKANTSTNLLGTFTHDRVRPRSRTGLCDRAFRGYAWDC